LEVYALKAHKPQLESPKKDLTPFFPWGVEHVGITVWKPPPIIASVPRASPDVVGCYQTFVGLADCVAKRRRWPTCVARTSW
jgi:hypothetical protein